MGHIQATGFYMIHQWIAIENLVATTISDTRIDLSWDILKAGMTGIVIEQSTDGINYTEIDFLGGTEDTYSVTGLTTNTHYYFRVRGVKASTYSEYSNVADDWTAMKLVYTANGDGSATSNIFNVKCIDTNITVTIDGNGKFYTNPAGTTGESSSWTIVTGDYRNTYVKVTSGTANMLWFHKGNLTDMGRYPYPPTGGVTLAIYQGSVNGPNVTVGLSALPDCLETFAILQSYGGSVTGSLADVPSGLKMLYIQSPGTISGNVSSLPDVMEHLMLVSANTITGDVADLPSAMFLISVAGANTLSGNVSGFTETMEYLSIAGVNTITGNVSGFPDSLTFLNITGNNTISGDVNGFPQNGVLKTITIAGQNTITGDLAGLDYTGIVLDYFSITGQNTINGDVADIADSIVTFNVGGQNTISGDISGIPTSALTSLSISGQNTISGDLADLPLGLIVTYFSISGVNTIEGDIANIPEGVTYFFVAGNTTVSGSIADLPSTIKTLYVVGTNTISGDIADLPSGITTLIMIGNNTITGDIANFPASVTRIEFFGLNTLYGDFADLSNNITIIRLAGRNVISDYTSGKTWNNNIVGNFDLVPYTGGGLDATEVDNLFIDLDTSWTTTRTQTIDMRGTNAAPTATSLTARNSLIAKGRTIYVNT